MRLASRLLLSDYDVVIAHVLSRFASSATLPSVPLQLG
jgi:hypothetical protein